ncbi:hypothetical protein V2J09_015884 [Rumex salicifolius]
MGRLKYLRRITIPTHPTTNSHGGHRAFITEATKNLRKLFDGRSEKEKEADEACEKALEAAESLKEGAKEVKETCEFVRDTLDTTSQTVAEATVTVKEKMKEPVKGLVSDTWGAATKKIEDKMVEKIRSRVLGDAHVFGKPKKS